MCVLLREVSRNGDLRTLPTVQQFCRTVHRELRSYSLRGEGSRTSRLKSYIYIYICTNTAYASYRAVPCGWSQDAIFGTIYAHIKYFEFPPDLLERIFHTNGKDARHQTNIAILLLKLRTIASYITIRYLFLFIYVSYRSCRKVNKYRAKIK